MTVKKYFVLLTVFITLSMGSLSAQVAGCEYPSACNYNPDATVGDGSCIFAEPGYDCDGNCIVDNDANGVCDDQEIYGCTYPDALNYDAAATRDDETCLYTCKGDFNNDATIDANDLLGFLTTFGNSCSDAGCLDENACNFDPDALYSDNSCTYPEEVYLSCEGQCLNDTDGDGVCNEIEVPGCTDPEATNFNADATDDDGSCVFGITGDTHTCGAEDVHNPELTYGSVTDIDGNTYRTIVIGEDEWMAENLVVAHYANGDPIPEVTGNSAWVTLGSGAWCYYQNNETFECPYGKLYNWYVTIDDRNVCPTGWHVATDEEWSILTDLLGGSGVTGGILKNIGGGFWDGPNTGATNEVGFSGLPGGFRTLNGTFNNQGDFASFWTSSEVTADHAWLRTLFSNSNFLGISDNDKYYGFSIRCVRD